MDMIGILTGFDILSGHIVLDIDAQLRRVS
ncbi:hypothetical protein P775_27405 [Puniceibacterium antarcticum]|uniref:Uncharacterized protein n=1 Tax=Puniceibacterium antarcticum TaxID=1206336 RepID=A0A2G8QWL8_9RHOB|nr:hypothetical protein P775_27405 [Puniceibacterium antarcticum]